MWKTVEINNSIYLINWKHDPGKDTFLLSDLKELWGEEVETKEMHHRFKELNPLIDPRGVISDLNVLSNSVSSSIKIEQEENRKLIDVATIDDNVTLKFKWELNKKSNDDFFKEITLNLIWSVITLNKRQEELFSLLAKKDKEKNEYVREFGEISRDFLKTVKFNKEEFVGGSNSGMCETFSCQFVIDNLKSTYGMKIEKRKVDPEDNKEAKKIKKYEPKFLKRPTTK